MTTIQRSQNIRTALERYRDATGSETEHMVTDFLADLAHYCDHHGLSLSDAMNRAQEHYLEETQGQRHRQSFSTI